MRGRSGLPALKLLAASAAGALAFLLTAGPGAAETLSPLNKREAGLLDKMNAVRRNHGLRPLRLCERLEDAAARHAKSMARNGYSLHDLYTPKRIDDWTPINTWLPWYWPGPGYTSWWMGENIAWGAPELSARRAMRFWMHSAPHRANILGNFNRVGIEAVHVQDPAGSFRSYSDVTVWSVDFGKRSG
jgi:uncharacterized protein YkwD